MATHKPRIQLLSLQTGTDVGGTEFMAFNTLSRFDHDKFDITVCFLAPAGPVSALYAGAGIRVVHLRSVGDPAIRAVGRLWTLLSLRRFDVIEIYGLRLNLLGRIIARVHRQPVIITAQRSVDDWRRWWHVWLDRLSSRWVRLYIANSHAAARRLASREHIAWSKLTVIENGVDTDAFDAASRIAQQRKSASPTGPVVITCVANLRRPKAHHILIDAFARLCVNHPDVVLRLVGDGNLRGTIEAQVRTAGVASRVVLMGHRWDIPDILADSDIFVLSSVWEGMPGSILEAMAAGLPVVATSVGGIPEVVVNDETGYLVPPANAEQLATALERLVVSPDTRQSMGALGRSRVAARFSISSKVAEYQALYLSLVEDGPSWPTPETTQNKSR